MDIQPQKVAPKFTYRKPLIIKELRQFFLASFKDIYAVSLSTGDIIHCLKGHKAKVVGICRNPSNANSIISCDENGVAICWAHATNKEQNQVYQLETHKQNIAYFNTIEDSFIVGYSCGTLRVLSSLEDGGVIVMRNVSLKVNQISNNASIICGIRHKTFSVSQFPTNGVRRHTQKHKLLYFATSLACHPHTDTVAVGGPRGIISIYKNACYPDPIITNYYWHFLPLTALAFNSAGNELYSGGGECVLVKWKLEMNCKKFMPRLGMPIENISVDDEETVITQVDNDITIYHGETEPIEKGDSYIMSNSSSEIFLFHSPTNCLITHGWTGYLQFYSLKTNRRKFQIDITMENVTPVKGDEPSLSYVVQAAAVSADGNWIVTYDWCLNYPEEHGLKFWRYSEHTKKWEMNTIIKTAHGEKITSLSISKERSFTYYCVSCSEDKKAKVWCTTQIGKRKFQVNWILHTVKEMHRSIPKASAFHDDVSVLAIAYKNYIVVYDMDGMKSINSIYCDDKDIVELQFTSDQHGSFILARSATCLNVWDFTFKEIIRFNFDSSCMAINTSTGIIALCHRTESSVYFVKIVKDTTTWRWQIKVELEFMLPKFVTAEAALWMPTSSKQVLYFKTNAKELYKLDNCDADETDNLIVASESSVETPFSRLLSTTKTSLVQPQKANVGYAKPVNGWLRKKIDSFDLREIVSFSDLVFDLQNKILPDL